MKEQANGRDIDPADIWEAYCKDTVAKDRSLQGAVAFAVDAVLRQLDAYDVPKNGRRHANKHR